MMDPVILKHIGSYLEYNDRINFNMAVPFEARFVRKLNSDSHNLKIKCLALQEKMSKVLSTESSVERALLITKLFEYLLETNDTAMFTFGGRKLRDVIFDKLYETPRAPYFEQNYRNAYVRYVRKRLNKVADKLYKKINRIPLREQIPAEFVKIL